MTKLELLQKAKPILFNTDMVRAIMTGKKTVTRRVANINTNHCCIGDYPHKFIRDDFADGIYSGFVCQYCGFGVCPPHSKYPVGSSFIRPRYNVGDILYIRETWGNYRYDNEDGGASYFMYRADHPDGATEFVSADGKVVCGLPEWRPSIFMPKEAARTFLRVTDVKLERLHDFLNDERGPEAEGCASKSEFIAVWETTIKEKDRQFFGWEANPYVWKIEFEKM